MLYLKQDKMKNEYTTQDLYEAAALYSTGERLTRLITQRKPYFFAFEDVTSCEEKSIQYINGELQVNAKEYADAVKLLKSKVNTM